MTDMRRTACATLVAALLIAAPGRGVLVGQYRIDWGNLATLPSGRPIVVQLLADATPIEGTYVGSDEHTLTLAAGGLSRVVDRADVLRVLAPRDSRRRHPVAIGAAAGAAVGVASVAGQEDWSALGRVMWASIGVAVGALAGLIASRGADTQLIYEVRPLPPNMQPRVRGSGKAEGSGREKRDGVRA